MPAVLNFVSDVATPHVNQLLTAVRARGDVELRSWYAYTGDKRGYSWKVDPTTEIPDARVFGPRPCTTLLATAASPLNREAFMIVGWSNPTTRLLIPLLAARRRRFAFFTDRPRDAEGRFGAKALMREGYFGLLRSTACVFAVGQSAVDYFERRGFSPQRLCNLPMPVPVVPDLARFRSAAPALRQELGVPTGGFLMVSGSRLTRDKGFDLLIEAVASLPAITRPRCTLLIVGDGPEREALEEQARERGVGAQVHFRAWMDFEEFCRHMCAADIVVHPARFDAFGGTTLTAVAVGAPVVGARQAGAVEQFVTDGVNGRAYDAKDVAALSEILASLAASPGEVERLARAARQASSQWTAEHLADTLVRRLRAEGILDSRSKR